MPSPRAITNRPGREVGRPEAVRRVGGGAVDPEPRSFIVWWRRAGSATRATATCSAPGARLVDDAGKAGCGASG
jgi:hypothetical protein